VSEGVVIYTNEYQQPLEFVQHYPVIFSDTSGPYDVISDIDDTIMVSYTADFLKRITTVAFNSAQRRRTISYTYHLFKALEKQDSRMFYVSKSESNLFGMISTFLIYHKLPKGDIFLTPYLKFNQLFSSKKGKSYKEETISFIIKNSSKKFILVGDDSQKDMNAYTTVAMGFPDRIYKIYIRQTKRLRSKRQLEKWQELKSTGANIIYFNKNDVFDEISLII
jgi:phosphatidate phosphatase APP1